MGDLFATATRAPVAEHSRELPGTALGYARLEALARIDVSGVVELVRARVVSLPDRGRAPLNRVTLQRGRRPDPSRFAEVLLSAPFAEARGLGLGDTLTAILDDRRQALTVVGIALSADTVYTVPPGTLTPDDKRYGVI